MKIRFVASVYQQQCHRCRQSRVRETSHFSSAAAMRFARSNVYRPGDSNAIRRPSLSCRALMRRCARSRSAVSIRPIATKVCKYVTQTLRKRVDGPTQGYRPAEYFRQLLTQQHTGRTGRRQLRLAWLHRAPARQPPRSLRRSAQWLPRCVAHRHVILVSA